jgi:ATP-dependent protease ClpP protease subunit
MRKFLIPLTLLCSTAFAKPVEIILTERNSVSFNQAFTSEYVAKKQLEIFSKNNMLARSEPIYLVMDTPGGSVVAGLNFIDSLKSLKRPVHTVTLFAASMGYQVVQELGTRYITPSGTLMSHRGAVSGIGGQIPGELNARLGYIQGLLEQMNKKAASRLKTDVEAYKASIVNELWIFGQQAVDTRNADAIADVRCDKKLVEGKYIQQFNTIFGSVDVVFSKCPLISGPIGFSFSKEFKAQNRGTFIKNVSNSKRRIHLNF